LILDLGLLVGTLAYSEVKQCIIMPLLPQDCIAIA